MQAKRSLRRDLLDARRAVERAPIAAASDRVVAALRALPELAGAPTVLLYAADPDEIDVDALVRTPPDGWTVLLPRVEGEAIVAVLVRPGAPLRAGHRGIREPDGPPVDPTTIDAVIVPGVAFTPQGDRLGRGAGLYDRLLPRLDRAVRIGVCAEGFVHASLPVEPHDATVDVVVSDASVRRRTDDAGAPPA
jgi:5-formyltetrahydrofolate cyclo-ligase